MNELNEQLRTLALAAQTHPPRSPERQQYLHQLISAIEKSGQQIPLHCPSDYRGAYQEIYHVAVQKTYQYICENINRYQAEEGEVMAWFNGILKYKFVEALREVANPGTSRNWSGIPRYYLDDLARSPGENLESLNYTTMTLSEQIIQIIQEDPEGLFEAKTMKSNPRVNFKWLAIKRIEGYSWQEIAEEVGSKIASLSHFYQRSLEEFSATIKSYIC